MNAPRRWKEADSGASVELRAVLQHAQSTGPDAAQLAALTGAVLDKLPALIADPSGAGALMQTGALQSAARWSLAKLAAVAGASVLAAAGAVVWHGAEQPKPHAPPAIQANVVPVVPPSETEQPAPPNVEALRALPVPERPHRARIPRAEAQTELQLLQGARVTLHSSPRAALVLLEEHARRFPESALSEEREALFIRLLMASDPEKARARLRAFEQRYPRSPYRRRLASLELADAGAASGVEP